MYVEDPRKMEIQSEIKSKYYKNDTDAKLKKDKQELQSRVKYLEVQNSKLELMLEQTKASLAAAKTESNNTK